MGKKIRVVNNIHGKLGFCLNPMPESIRLLKTQGDFIDIDEDELRHIYINQEIVQRGMLWIEDKNMRIEFGLEKEDGTKENANILKYNEIKELVQGNFKRLEKVLGEVNEPNIILQFVEAAREIKIDSRAKIDLIEKKSGMLIYEDKE